MQNLEIHLDSLSFWLGFLAATLFWWLYSRIKPMLPVWQKQLRHQIELISSRNFAGVDEYLRRQTILRAQGAHLAAPLFSLDEVLTIPRLLVPPSGQDPNEPGDAQSIPSTVIPYLPDWPELVVPFGVPTLTLAEAIQSKRHIAVIGQPGSGKTVALAHLATQLSRGDPQVKNFASTLALYLHVIDLETARDENNDPVQSLIKSVIASSSMVMQPQITRYLNTVIHNKNRPILLLLDGMDELPENDLATAVSFLDALIKKLPQVQIITAASADFVNGLTHAGFYPLSLAAWTTLERKVYAKKWGDLWTQNVLPETPKNSVHQTIDPILLEDWLNDSPSRSTPLDWTLRLWGAYAGDLSGDNRLDSYKSYLTRFLPDPSILPAVSQLAYSMVMHQSAAASYEDMDKLLSSVKVPDSRSKPGQPLDDPIPAGEASATPPEGEQATSNLQMAKKLAPKLAKGVRMEKITSPGGQVIEALLAAGVLSQHPNNQLRFSCPVLMGYLASSGITSEEANEIVSATDFSPAWAPRVQMLRFAAACEDDPTWIKTLLSDQKPPLYRNLFMAARWMSDAPIKSGWRNALMRSLYSLILDQSLPLSILARFIAAFYVSGDQSTDKLFQQLLSSKSTVIRRVGLLGSGASGNPKAMDYLLSSLSDSAREVRFTACLALASIPGERTLKVLVDILLSGDEEIRQAAAEALAQNPDEGHQILREAITHEDLLTRRAAVFGLMQVREAWALKALEKAAVEDGQWVVRNAAAQAIQTLQQNTSPIPSPLKAPSETGWLITLASKSGQGILPGQPATDLLLTTLEGSNSKESIAALSFLRDQPEDATIRKILVQVNNPDEAVREAAIHALWWIAISGAKIPAMN